MYERFTDRAQKTLYLAEQEAWRLNHEYVGTEHLLLALIHLERGVALEVLKHQKVKTHEIERMMEQMIQPLPDGSSSDRLPQSPRAKKVIELALEESQDLGHNYVGTEHLLLGMLREGNGVAAQILNEQGLELEQVRKDVLQILRSQRTSQQPNFLAKNTPHLDRMTDRAQWVMHLAYGQAFRLSLEQVGTEHMLLAMIKAENGVAANVLKEIGLNLRNVDHEVRKLSQPGLERRSFDIPLSARVQELIEFAMEECRKLDHKYIGTEHLLLGLTRVETGGAAQVFEAFGIEPAEIRRGVHSILGTKESE